MHKISSKNIAEYLDEINWSYRLVDDAIIRTAFRCPVPFYDYAAPFEVQVTEHWVYLRALLQRDVHPARCDAVLRLITAWNEGCHLVKFLIVQNCVVLQADIPVVQCHFGSFQDSLQAIYRYSSQAGGEIAVLATNPSVSGLYAELAVDQYARRAGTMGRGRWRGGPGVGFELPFNV